MEGLEAWQYLLIALLFVWGGFVHRIERLNAFVACSHSGQDHMPTFLICRTCKAVAEAPKTGLRDRVQTLGQEADFALESIVVEGLGLCSRCRSDQ